MRTASLSPAGCAPRHRWFRPGLTLPLELGGPLIGHRTHSSIGPWAARRRGPSAWHSQEPREPALRCQASCEGKRARGQCQHGALTRPRKIFATNVPPGGSTRSSAGVYLGGRLGGAPGRHCGAQAALALLYSATQRAAVHEPRVACAVGGRPCCRSVSAKTARLLLAMPVPPGRSSCRVRPSAATNSCAWTVLSECV